MADVEPTMVVIGGLPLRLRAIRPEDEPALRAGFAQLSPAARYARFRGVGSPTDAQWRYLTRVDGRHHVAIVAVAPTGEIVGVARFIRTDASGEAEVAFTVADTLQRMGLGQALLDALVPLAKARGVTTLTAFTAASNTGMVRLFLSRGGHHVSTHQGEASLALPIGEHETTEARRVPSRRTRWSLARVAARARASARFVLKKTGLRAA